MRALIFRNSPLVVDDMPDPEPDEGQVLVKTLAAGICGSDVHIRDLAAQAPPGSFPEEVVWGHEFCCELLGYGAGTEQKLKPGTRVCSVPIAYSTRGASMLGSAPERPGGFAERMVLNESMLVPVPDGMPTEHAVLTEPMAVGWHAVEQSRVQPGDVPLVIGCGPVGLAVIAGLAIKGVHPIIAADFSPTRRKMAETMGADIVLDPADGSPYERWQRELTPDGIVADASSQVDIRAILSIRWISDVPSKIVKILDYGAVSAGQRPDGPGGISTSSARPVRDKSRFPPSPCPFSGVVRTHAQKVFVRFQGCLRQAAPPHVHLRYILALTCSPP